MTGLRGRYPHQGSQNRWNIRIISTLRDMLLGSPRLALRLHLWLVTERSELVCTN